MYSTEHGPLDVAYMQRCLELVRQSLDAGDHPFGAVVVQNGVIIAEGTNTILEHVAGHAEVNAMQAAVVKLGAPNLSTCTLYTNCEPCAMCAVLVRDLGVKKVVFGCPSPKWGGLSRWNILEASLLSENTSATYPNPPEVVGGVLCEETKKIFDQLGWTMHRAE